MRQAGNSMRLAALLVLMTTFWSPMTTAHETDSEADSGVGYAKHPDAAAFVSRMVEQGFDADDVTRLLDSARRKESILKAIARPAEKRLTWGEYRKIFLKPQRIEQGIQFWNEHAATIRRAAEQYGVAPEIIVAIIGVETRYGRNAGSYRVLDALATLAFDYPPRSRFFTGQLEQYLLLLREEKLTAESIKGSYAGAMGFGQFIPSSYRHYAVDFDGDARRDIVTNPVDAIGSVANYFKQHGWRSGEPVALQADLIKPLAAESFSQALKPEHALSYWLDQGLKPRLSASSNEALDSDQKTTAMLMEGEAGEEYWLGLPNFYVITRYNHSALYAMAVFQLSQEILTQYQSKASR